MPREQEGFRDVLADILEHTGGARWLTLKEVGTFLGIDARTVKSRFGVSKQGIAAAELARKMCRVSNSTGRYKA